MSALRQTSPLFLFGLNSVLHSPSPVAASYLLTEGSFFFRPRRRLFSSSFFAPQGNPADPPTSMGNALDDDLQSDLRSDLARQLREESSGDNLREMGTDEIDSIQEILARRWIKEDFLVGDTDDDDDISSSKSYPSQNPTPKRNPKQNPSTTAPRQGEGEEAEEPAEYESTDAYFGRPRAYAEPYRDPTEAPELRSERMALERIASGPDGARAVKACIGLGHGHFEKRWGRDIHREQSRRWFMRAALMGDPLAMRIVALRFEMHRGNKQLILKKSAELGDIVSMELVAGEAMRVGDPNTAAAWNWRAAEGGSASAAYNLYVQLRTGVGVKRDRSRAEEYLKQASERGHALATWKLGQLQRSEALVERAAELGLCRAQLSWAKHCFQMGRLEEAANWYHKAAAQHSMEAKFLLGVHYMRNELKPPADWVVQNPVQLAADMLMDAAVQGHADAKKLMKAFSPTDTGFNPHKQKGRRFK